MKNFLANFPFRELSIFVTIVGSFTYNVLLDRDMACTCTHVGSDCTLYMVLPFFIIFLLILWTDKTLERICKYTFICEKLNKEEPAEERREEPAEERREELAEERREELAEEGKVELKEIGRGKPTEKTYKPPVNCTDKSECCRYYTCRTELCGVFWTRLLKAVGVGVLWVASVLIDGDWYVCCQYDQSKNQSQLACKDKNNITAEENVAIDTLKNTSKNFGFGVLLGIIFLAALMTLCGWRRCICPCCERWACCSCLKKSCCSRRQVYDTVILEEGKNVLDKVFKEAAKEELFEMIFKKIKGNRGGGERGNGGGEENNWIECLDVASGMVERKSEPKLSKIKQKKLLDSPKQEP